jgi:hypothetical protein
MIITKQLRDYAKEHNEPIDWRDYSQRKYFIGWDFTDKEISISWDFTDKEISISWYSSFKGSDIYFSSEEIAEAAVKEIGVFDVKKYYLGVED